MIINKLFSLFSANKNQKNLQNTRIPQYGPFDLQKDTFTIIDKPVSYNPLNKYSAIAPYRGRLIPTEGVWRQAVNKQQSHCGWKMHLYANNGMDLQNILNAVGPYLDENDILWKTALNTDALLSLKGGAQEGKAFTIYPKSNRQFEQIARDVDYILRRNNLQTKKSSIIGDKELGKTGRIFYRYEFNTVNAKDLILDLSEKNDWNIYDKLYDYNRGKKNYLAFDMTTKDDPWCNWDPAKDNRIYIDNIDGKKIKEIETCKKDGNKYCLEKDTPYPMKNLQYLVLFDRYTLDLSNPQVSYILQNLKNNEYILVGRGMDCNIKIGADDSDISRHHILIQKMANELFVTDISTNGTSVIRKNYQ